MHTLVICPFSSNAADLMDLCLVNIISDWPTTSELDRRKPGQSRITTPRNEDDQVEILSGLSPEGLTLGTPIAMLVRNKVPEKGVFGVGPPCVVGLV